MDSSFSIIHEQVSHLAGMHSAPVAAESCPSSDGQALLLSDQFTHAINAFTPAPMSEMQVIDKRQTSTAADMFSFGMLAWRMFYRQWPAAKGQEVDLASLAAVAPPPLIQLIRW